MVAIGSIGGTGPAPATHVTEGIGRARLGLAAGPKGIIGRGGARAHWPGPCLSAAEGPGVFPAEAEVTTPDQTLTNDFLRLVREFAHANALDPFGVLALTASSLCLMSVA